LTSNTIKKPAVFSGSHGLSAVKKRCVLNNGREKQTCHPTNNSHVNCRSTHFATSAKRVGCDDQGWPIQMDGKDFVHLIMLASETARLKFNSGVFYFSLLFLLFCLLFRCNISNMLLCVLVHIRQNTEKRGERWEQDSSFPLFTHALVVNKNSTEAEAEALHKYFA